MAAIDAPFLLHGIALLPGTIDFRFASLGQIADLLVRLRTASSASQREALLAEEDTLVREVLDVQIEQLQRTLPHLPDAGNFEPLSASIDMYRRTGTALPEMLRHLRAARDSAGLDRESRKFLDSLDVLSALVDLRANLDFALESTKIRAVAIAFLDRWLPVRLSAVTIAELGYKVPGPPHSVSGLGRTRDLTVHEASVFRHQNGLLLDASVTSKRIHEPMIAQSSIIDDLGHEYLVQLADARKFPRLGLRRKQLTFTIVPPAPEDAGRLLWTLEMRPAHSESEASLGNSLFALRLSAGTINLH